MTDICPWDINPELQREYIVKVAKLIANVRGEVIDLHDEESGDTALSLGMRAYERCRTRFISSAETDEMPWLSILTPTGRFTFRIRNTPVRFARNQPDELPYSKLIASKETEEQFNLFPDTIEYTNILWFFIIDTNYKRIADNMYFVGYDRLGNIVCQWKIPTEDIFTSPVVVEDIRSDVVELPKASVKVKKVVKSNTVKNE